MYDFATRQRLGMLTRGFVGTGADALSAHQQALAVIQGEAARQANVLAFGKLYLVSALMMIVSLPLLLLLRRVPHGTAPRPAISDSRGADARLAPGREPGRLDWDAA